MSRRMRRRWRWAISIGLVAAALFGPGLCQITQLSVMQWRLDRRLAVLAAQQERLTQEQARLRSDATYVEGLIRSTFKVAQPGEYVITEPSGRSESLR